VNKLKVWVFGARLIQAGARVTFIARGQQLKSLKETGLSFCSFGTDSQKQTKPERHQFENLQCFSAEGILHSINSHEKPDLIMFFNKVYSNTDAISFVQKLKDGDLKLDCPLFVMQNGIKSHKDFEEHFKPSMPIYRGIMNIACYLESPGRIIHKSGGLIILQNGHKAAEKLKDLFFAAKVECKLSTNIDYEIWHKALWNAPFNSATAISRLSTSPILASVDGMHLIKQIAQEVILLANACGVEMKSNSIDHKIKFTLQELGNISTSTREDVLAGKPIEAEAVVGDLVCIAEQKKIQVPYLDAMYRLLKLIDITNRQNATSTLNHLGPEK
jgi:2-dehydropantoate 2-reductase